MPETLSVRNILVLGIGSTGKEVAERMANYLTWRFGSLEKAAWVRILVLETAQPSSILGDRIIHTGIKVGPFQEYLDSPQTAGADFGFKDWQDGALLGTATPPEHGAGNVRMVGRLCLLHTPNYRLLQTRVTREIDELRKLTNPGIQEALGRTDVTINRQHPDAVCVYVVGTLCGGTCSGGAADIGYLLDVWNAQRPVQRQAIFTVPHPDFMASSEAARYKKNAYHALKELNHYQLADTVWEQKLPGHNEPYFKTRPPYEIVRIMRPLEATMEGVTKLNTMIGQYLAAAAGSAGHEIEERDVNARNKMDAAPAIGYMRPLFSTMGVASLEIPGELILSAMNERLLDRTLSTWVADDAGSPSERDRRRLGPLNFNTLLDDFIKDYKASVVDSFKETFAPVHLDQKPNLTASQLAKKLKEVDRRLSSPVGDDALSTTLQNRQGTMLSKIEPNLGTFVRECLLRRECGPVWVTRILRLHQAEWDQWVPEGAKTDRQRRAEAARGMIDPAIVQLEKLEQRIAQLEAALQANIPAIAEATAQIVGMQAQVKEQEERILKAQKAIAEKRRGVLGRFANCKDEEREIEKAQEILGRVKPELATLMKQHANSQEAVYADQTERQQKQDEVLTAWKSLESLVMPYLATAVEAEALKQLTREEYLQNQRQTYAAAIRNPVRRLDRLVPLCKGKQGQYATAWNDKATNDPKVNGKAIFQPSTNPSNGTVIETYERCIIPPHRYSEETAQQHILDGQAALLDDVLRPDAASWLDPQVGRPDVQAALPAEKVEALENRAQDVFEQAYLELLLANRVPEAAADVKALIAQSEPTMAVAAVQLSEQLAGTRGVRPQQQNIALMDKGENNADTPETLAVQRTMLQEISLEGNGVMNSHDPFRLLLIQERHGFTFGQMDGVISKNARDRSALQSSDSTDFSFWHARKGVDWVDPLASPLRLQTTEELWLTILLLGHPTNAVLQWLPSNLGEVVPEGWYTGSQGQFKVFYVGGVDRTDGELLPQDFTTAVARLMSKEYDKLKRSLDIHFNKYCVDNTKDPARQSTGEVGADPTEETETGAEVAEMADEQKVLASGFYRAVWAMEEGLDALGSFGIKGLNKEKAGEILLRLYRRNGDMAEAFYFYRKQKIVDGRGTFAGLEFKAGDELPNGETAKGYGYYCSNGHPQGVNIEALHQRRFLCEICGDGERYWP